MQPKPLVSISTSVCGKLVSNKSPQSSEPAASLRRAQSTEEAGMNRLIKSFWEPLRLWALR